jgi:hypothetical protein
MVKCGKCGRKLTNPISVRRGIGPICWEKIEKEVEQDRTCSDARRGLQRLRAISVLTPEENVEMKHLQLQVKECQERDERTRQASLKELYKRNKRK